jgi:hypothetical protein
MPNIDSIILGDNQFFGVNHRSQDRGRETYEHFKDISEIKKTIYYALDNGVKGVMFSTYPAIYQITDAIRNDPALKNNLSIYVNVPYIFKYVRMASEMGIFQSIKFVLKGKSTYDNLKYIFQGAKNLLTQDYLGIANRLVDVELSPFYDLNIKAIFLHNCLCDLALGYQLTKALKNFDHYISKKYKVTPAFGTLNYPLFCKMLKDAGIEQSLIMTAVNKRGFLMNPSRVACEDAIRNNVNVYNVLAMATLASGSLKPEEAYEYLFTKNKIKHIAVGLSSKKHADETFKIIHRYLG